LKPENAVCLNEKLDIDRQYAQIAYVTGYSLSCFLSMASL